MAIEKTINIDVNSKKAQKDVKDLEKSIEGVNKEVKEVSESSSELTGQLDNLTGGAISKFKGLRGTLKNVITSFKSLKVAIIGTGIGALLIAVVALGQAFTRSEEGQNKFQKILGVIGSVVGNLLDLLADLGENIISAFENPEKAWNSFTDSLNKGYQFIKKQVIDRFQGGWEVLSGRVESGILKMRIAWNEFTGDSEEAELLRAELEEVNKKVTEGVQKIANANKAIVEVYESAKDKLKEFSVEVAKDAANAAKIADLRAKADRLDRKLIVDRAKADRDRATLLEQSVNKEKFTVQERISFLQEAADLEEKITNQEIEAARLRLQAQQAENALGKSTKEDKEAAAQLEANLIQLETARLTKQKEVTSQIIAFKAEEAAALKAIADQKAAEDKERLDRIAAEEKERKDKQEQEEKERNERRIAEEKAVADAEMAIKNASLDAATSAFNIIASTDKKNKKLQAAMLIATNAVGIAQNIINTKAANARLTAEAGIAAPPLILANNIRMITGIAASVAATAQGLRALKSGGAASGGGVTSTTSASGGAAPSFNVVGATETSQLADAIGGQTQQPVQAFVVANDVTTAQSLENNIVEGATL